jgi:PKD repeat protein
MLDLTGQTAQLANWATARYADECSASFNSYMRDLDFSPDGSFFVVSTTGAARGTSKLCDSQARWENVANGTGKQPTWVNWTGGDTTYAVEVTDHVIYVGGHFRWSNNAYGVDTPGQGAVDRQGLVALDPSNGLPFTWNPGRTRGVGVFDLLVTDQGLWIGSDTDIAGGETHMKVAMFPAAGGAQLPLLEAAKLPGDVYSGGATGTTGADYLKHRSFDGTTAGSETADGTAGLDWRTTRGAFMISGRLYHGSADGNLYGRTFDGASLGEPENMDGGDLLTPMTTWHSQVKAVQGMFYHDGKIYYTRGQSALNYRYFTPESKVVGAVELTAAANLPGVDWRNVGGMFVSGGKFYYVSTTDGKLRAMDFTGGVPSGTPAVVDEGDWRGRSVFVRADIPNQAPTATFTRSCTDLACSFDATASSDPDGTIASYAWDFGDGSDGTGATPEHAYTAGGTYTVKLTVTDHRGGTDTSQQTVTVAENRSGIAFRGTDGFNANTRDPVVTVPSGVEAGDGMLLFLTLNSSAVTATPPAGWAQVGTQSNSGSTSVVWSKVAGAGDAGNQVAATLSDYAKADMRLVAYADTGASPVGAVAELGDGSQVEHRTPDVAVTEPGSWVVSYWSEKSALTTAWTGPDAGQRRAVSIGTGAGHITSLLVDSDGAVPTGTFTGLTATADQASRALMWSIVLRPAS